jgi:hypothetical protein
VGGVLATLLFATRSQAEVAWDGHKLHAVCAQSSERQPGGNCAVYIRGEIDRFHEFIAAHCPHQTVSFGEIVREVVTYLENHPSERGEAGPDLILKSLKLRYGCAF